MKTEIDRATLERLFKICNDLLFYWDSHEQAGTEPDLTDIADYLQDLRARVREAEGNKP